jgi:hypothetical protein
MTRCNTFEDLQALGAEKIHERTHISRDKMERFLSKSYDEIARVQFMGYLSILEREYGIDLSATKEEYNAFHRDNETLMLSKTSAILQSNTNSKSKWIAAGIVGIAALMGGGYLLQGVMSSAPKEEVMHLTTANVNVVDIQENNQSEANETVAPSILAQEGTEENTSAPIKNQVSILPTYKVWYGIIDTASQERKQNTTKEPITIDGSKNYLIVLGHGKIEIQSAEGKTELNESDRVYFVTEEGKLKLIPHKEFVERNGGKEW